jgi:hypothetical protein
MLIRQEARFSSLNIYVHGTFKRRELRHLNTSLALVLLILLPMVVTATPVRALVVHNLQITNKGDPNDYPPEAQLNQPYGITVSWSQDYQSSSGMVVFKGREASKVENLPGMGAGSYSHSITVQFFQSQQTVSAGVTVIAIPSDVPEGETCKGCSDDYYWTITVSGPSCPDNQVWNGAQCVCPSGQEWNGQQCVTPQPSCPDNQVWNGAQCVCPSGQEWNGQQCVTPRPSCQPPSLDLFNPGVDGLAVNVNGVTKPGCSDVTVTRTHWDWGDGQSGDYWFPASHTYSSGGTYTITVTSYQSDEQSTTRSVTVIVPSAQQLCLHVKSETKVGSGLVPVAATIDGISPSSCSYSAGQVVTLEVKDEKSSDGYFFLAWIVDGALVGTDKSVQVIMNSNHDVVAAYVDLSTLQNFADQVGSVLDQDYIHSTASKIATDAWNGVQQTTIDSPGVAGSMQTVIDVLQALGAKNLPGIPVVGFMFDIASIANDVSQCNPNQPSSSCDLQQATKDLDGITGNAVLAITTTVICAALSVPTVGLAGIACAVSSVFLAQIHAPGQSMNFGEWIGSKVHGFFADVYKYVTDWWKGVWAKIEGGSSVVLMLVDSQGRRIGATLEYGSIVTYYEIPATIYSGAESHPQQILLLQPIQGGYTVLVTGIGSGGSYSLTASLTDKGGTTISTISGSGFVLGGQTQSFSTNISSNAVNISGLWPFPPMTVALTAVGIAVVAAVFLYGVQARRKRRKVPRVKEIRSTSGKPKVTSIQETGSKPRVLKIEED